MSSNGSPYDTIDGYGSHSSIVDKQRLRDYGEKLNREAKAQHYRDLIERGVVCEIFVNGTPCYKCNKPKNCINDRKWVEVNKNILCYFICQNYKCPENKKRGYASTWIGIPDNCEYFDTKTKMCNFQIDSVKEKEIVISCKLTGLVSSDYSKCPKKSSVGGQK